MPINGLNRSRTDCHQNAVGAKSTVVAWKPSTGGAMSVRVVAGGRGLWLVSVGLLAVTAGGCAGGDRKGAPLPTSHNATTTSKCDSRAVAGAARIDRSQAEALRGQEVTLCEVSASRGGSATSQTTRTVVGDLDGHDFVPLMTFDGGPVPSGCDVSTDTRLFVLIESKWVEARQVGCGSDS